MEEIKNWDVKNQNRAKDVIFGTTNSGYEVKCNHRKSYGN